MNYIIDECWDQLLVEQGSRSLMQVWVEDDRDCAEHPDICAGLSDGSPSLAPHLNSLHGCLHPFNMGRVYNHISFSCSSFWWSCHNVFPNLWWKFLLSWSQVLLGQDRDDIKSSLKKSLMVSCNCRKILKFCFKSKRAWCYALQSTQENVGSPSHPQESRHQEVKAKTEKWSWILSDLNKEQIWRVAGFECQQEQRNTCPSCNKIYLFKTFRR